MDGSGSGRARCVEVMSIRLTKSCSSSSSSDSDSLQARSMDELVSGLFGIGNDGSLLALDIVLASSSTGSSGNVPMDACRERVIRGVFGATPAAGFFFSPLGGIYLKKFY